MWKTVLATLPHSDRCFISKHHLGESCKFKFCTERVLLGLGACLCLYQGSIKQNEEKSSKNCLVY